MQMACAQLKVSPFSDTLLAEARALWFRLLDNGLPGDSLLLAQVREHQPFFLQALGRSLRLTDDPDWRAFAESPFSFVAGPPVGVGVKMPRVPAVFEKKDRWRKLDETEFTHEVANYRSFIGAEDETEAQFAEEESLGMMYQLKHVDAVLRFPDLRIAAQGGIQKPDGSWRVLHDATHGVRVNNEVVIRDQVRMPTCADIRAVLGEDSELPGVHFSIQLDVSKAHRRVVMRAADRGFLCSRVRVDGPIWVNRVGCFGVSSAGYWWTRLASGISRLAWATALPDHLWSILYADDLKVTGHGERKYENILLMILMWCLVGTPFSWKKTRGGLEGEWIGLWIDYCRFEVGLSEKRSLWLQSWLARVTSGQAILVSSLAEGLGRLGWAAGPLEWARPFLGPLYAWCARLPQSSCLALPPMVRTTLLFLRDQLTLGRRMSSARKRVPLGCLFKADAKGEVDYVVIGGYSCRGTLKEVPWFSLRINASDAPWLFTAGHGSRTIATSELLASLVCVHLFAPIVDTDTFSGSVVMSSFSGVTDNAGNTYIVAKGSTTKFPVAPVLMELVIQLAARSLWLDLVWAPRLENTEADALTNDDFSLFNEDMRIVITWASLSAAFTSLTKFVNLGVEFYAELAEHKKKFPSTGAARRGKKARVPKALW